jgi:hypothetical protein
MEVVLAAAMVANEVSKPDAGAQIYETN